MRRLWEPRDRTHGLGLDKAWDEIASAWRWCIVAWAAVIVGGLLAWLVWAPLIAVAAVVVLNAVWEMLRHAYRARQLSRSVTEEWR